MSSLRRRMNARIRISLSSASVCTRLSTCSRLSSMTSPSRLTRSRASARRPVIMLPSPVKWPGPCATITSSPALRRPQDFDLAGQHHEPRHGLLPDLDEDLADGHRASFPERHDALELCGREDGKYSVVIRRRSAQLRMISAHGLLRYRLYIVSAPPAGLRPRVRAKTVSGSRSVVILTQQGETVGDLVRNAGHRILSTFACRHFVRAYRERRLRIARPRSARLSIL